MSTIQEKNIQTSSNKVIFDDRKPKDQSTKPLSIKQTEELENTIGKKIKDRLIKEFAAIGYTIPEKKS